MQTALQELISELKSIESYDPIVQGIIKRAESKLEKEKEQMINFYTWMRMNDSSEAYFHYSDEDMLNEYLNQNK
jgi:predicted transcriptional regulator